MELQKAIEIAEELRPGNQWRSEVVEQWLSEVDAEIQLEVCHKSIGNVVPLIPGKWEIGKKYAIGDRVAVRDEDKWKAYESRVDNNLSEPNTNQEWREVAIETYVGSPHDKLYYLYIIAMMDYANEEYDKYANDYAVYNAALEEFAKWWQRNYRYKKGDEDEYYLSRNTTRN